MNKFIFGSLFLAVLTFMGCPSSQVEENPLPKGKTQFDLTAYEIPATILIPDSTHGPFRAELLDNGFLRLQVGDKFHVEIREGNDMEYVREDLNDTAVFRHDIIDDKANLIIYKSALPTDQVTQEKVFYHFYGITNIDGFEYEVKDVEKGIPYSLAQIERMVASFKSIKAIKKSEPNT